MKIPHIVAAAPDWFCLCCVWADGGSWVNSHTIVACGRCRIVLFVFCLGGLCATRNVACVHQGMVERYLDLDTQLLHIPYYAVIAASSARLSQRTQDSEHQEQNTDAQDPRHTRSPEIRVFMFGRVNSFLFPFYFYFTGAPRRRTPTFLTPTHPLSTFHNAGPPPFPDLRPIASVKLSNTPTPLSFQLRFPPFLLTM